MAVKWKSMFIGLLTLFVLPGWTTLDLQTIASQQNNPEKLAAWDAASKKFIECNRVWQAERRVMSPQFNDIVVGSEDPRYLQSLTSKVRVSQKFKDALLKYRPQQIACRKELFANLGEKNIRVKLLYRQVFQSLDIGMADVLSGKLKTMGDVNRTYSKWVDEANDMSLLLRSALEGN